MKLHFPKVSITCIQPESSRNIRKSNANRAYWFYFFTLLILLLFYIFFSVFYEYAVNVKMWESCDKLRNDSW